MCLMVWVATELPVPALARTAERDARGDYARVEPISPDASVLQHVHAPCVTYVGSHEGCGCGFNSADVEWQGFDDEAELAPLVDALLDEEREAYRAERRSREHLHAIVTRALVDGGVTVHVCWAGDEGLPPVAVEEVDAGWLLAKTAPFKEGVQYRVVRP